MGPRDVRGNAGRGCIYQLLREQSAKGRSQSRLFKGLAHRSAGPLWDLLKRSAKMVGSDGVMSGPFGTLIGESYGRELEGAVTELAQAKHGKLPRGLNYPRVIGIVGNALAKVFEENCMGYFEGVQPAAFTAGRFKGVFRSIQGASEPFVNLFDYEGSDALPSSLVFMVSPEKGQAICLYPLIINGLKRLPSGGGPELYLFDVRRQAGRVFGYRGVRQDMEVEVQAEGEFSEVHARLMEMSEIDGQDNMLEGLTLLKRGENR